MRELKGVVPNKTAISCSSEELARQVHIILKECGYKWHGGDVLVENLQYKHNIHYHIYDEGFRHITHSGSDVGKTVVTAEEFIKINSNMEKLTKEQVYVSIPSDEEAIKLRDLLQKAGEPIYEGSAILRGLGANECASFWDVYWQYGRRGGTKQVTLEQLAEILGVKQQFKVGDRVRCKRGFSNQSSSNVYGGAGYIDGLQFEIGSINPHTSVDKIAYFDSGNKRGVYGKALELVTEAKPEQFVSVSRANLGRLYPIVCSSWQSYITSLLDNAGSFAIEVQVPLEKLRQAYKEADYTQKAILIEVAPLPKVKSTVNVSRFLNIYSDIQSTNTYLSMADALSQAVGGVNYISTIELTGEYTTEVEDPLMDLDEMPF